MRSIPPTSSDRSTSEEADPEDRRTAVRAGRSSEAPRAGAGGEASTTFLSDLIGREVRDANGERIGKLVDLVVPVSQDYPTIAALCLSRGREHDLLVGWDQVELVGEARPDLRLRVPLASARPYRPVEHEVFLVRQVLDRQVIDVNGTRLVRANDLQLTRTNGALRLAGVDVSTAAILKRLGLERPLQTVAGVFGGRLRRRVIDWADVDPVDSGPSGVRLRIAAENLARLRPADIAAIVSQLPPYHVEQVIGDLDPERAADTIEEFAPDLQTAVIEAMDNERAADVLDEMEPDEAADILGDIPASRREAILERMEPDEAEDVRELLAYPEDSAGGIMTTDFVTVPPDVTAEAAIGLVRARAADIDNAYYVYVVGADGRLVGVLSLRGLIVAAPERPVAEIMHHNLIVAHCLDGQATAARQIARYDLLALPVVDDEGRIRGIVTVDDAMDIILPTAWKKRLPRLFH